MIICSSLYSIVDGFFVSNFVGKTPFAAINLIMPVIMAISTIGFMIGTRGSAVVSITLGEKKPELANKYFSMLVYMELFTMTCRGFMLYALAFLFMGINVWGSAFFTALNNGLISATISFLRTLAFQIILIFVLPVLWGIDGIWLSVVFAEILSLIVTIAFFIAKRKKYKYV